MDLLVILTVGSIVGLLSAYFIVASRMGTLRLIIAGILGSFIGKYIAIKFHLPIIYTLYINGNLFPIVWVIIGAILLVIIFIMIGKYLLKHKNGYNIL